MSTYGIYLRDTDEPIITNTLQTLLYHADTSPLIGLSQQTNTNLNLSLFNIIGDGPAHLPFTHRQPLHNSLTKLISTLTNHHTNIAVDHQYLPHLHAYTTITTAFTQAHCQYLTDITMYLTFAEWRTNIPHAPHISPQHPSPTAPWNKHSSSLLPRPLAIVPIAMDYISNFTITNIFHTSDHIINPTVNHILPASNNNVLSLLRYYHSSLIIAIDGSYHPPIEPIVFPPPQLPTTTADHAVVSAVFFAIDNITQDTAWLE